MDLCTHPELFHVENPEEGGTASTTYQCRNCKALLTVAIKPFKITVSYGVPRENEETK